LHNSQAGSLSAGGVAPVAGTESGGTHPQHPATICGGMAREKRELYVLTHHSMPRPRPLCSLARLISYRHDANNHSMSAVP